MGDSGILTIVRISPPSPGLRSLTIRVLFPTEDFRECVCGGGMVSCQKDPGILCVSSEYSEDSVRRERPLH